ncbi:hypothetical protein RFI_13434 [Reticulomyxa filosa]|uniref:Uncharacterized protein n=1 Tax=Reticulomyxa filosa TaxID=46433 RepID=X6NCN6_RETFI|nr:hypothetical protein RFI_13434 [Reticulomyxa filosa]|eukprot:ETO23746.1 hypothetical protein RFI_13434 [Reticulomyxa filosa]
MSGGGHDICSAVICISTIACVFLFTLFLKQRYLSNSLIVNSVYKPVRIKKRERNRERLSELFSPRAAMLSVDQTATDAPLSGYFEFSYYSYSNLGLCIFILMFLCNCLYVILNVLIYGIKSQFVDLLIMASELIEDISMVLIFGLFGLRILQLSRINVPNLRVQNLSTLLGRYKYRIACGFVIFTLLSQLLLVLTHYISKYIHNHALLQIGKICLFFCITNKEYLQVWALAIHVCQMLALLIMILIWGYHHKQLLRYKTILMENANLQSSEELSESYSTNRIYTMTSTQECQYGSLFTFVHQKHSILIDDTWKYTWLTILCFVIFFMQQKKKKVVQKEQ